MITLQERDNVKLAKFKYYSSFLLIYPLFVKSKKEKFLFEKLQILATYKKRLIELVSEKQKILVKLYSANKSLENEKINSLFVSCAYTKITEKNFCKTNAQMDQIGNLIVFKKSFAKIKNEYAQMIWPYSDEIKLVSQYYYSILGMVKYKYKSFPWNSLLEMNNFSNFQITI